MFVGKLCSELFPVDLLSLQVRFFVAIFDTKLIDIFVVELLRLSEHLPPIFLTGADDMQPRYTEVLFDFTYLRAQDTYEQRINKDSELMDIDDDFMENHIEIITRFYQLFESIVKFMNDYKKYIDDITSGFFIQHTIDGILLDTDGKQLMAEALHLFGSILLILDRKIPGPAREKLIVAYYRGHEESNMDSFDSVVRLCRSTGYILYKQRPPGYPETFFERFRVDRDVVKMVVARIQSEDIYSQAKSYPSPEHRSVALSSQASMLYVMLYFIPEYLTDRKSTMREIVDRHFNDNWILSIYMGIWVDLQVAWKPYNAAFAALKNTIELDNVEEIEARNAKDMRSAQRQINSYLTEGVLNEEFVLNNIQKLLNILRVSNTSIKWRMLHRKTSDKRFHSIINVSGVSPSSIIQLLLTSSQLELSLKQMLKTLLEEKENKWSACKLKCAERMQELSHYFGGEVALTRVERDETLMEWFSKLKAEIESLEYINPTLTGRRIQKIIAALEEVEQFNEIDTSLQIKEFLAGARTLLMQMIRSISVQDSVLTSLEVVTDLSYAWEIIRDYTHILHERIRADPKSVVLLRSVFLKLASILDVPLVRISQIDSPDTISVAEYYSGELIRYVRDVLEIIPVTVFRVLTSLIKLETSDINRIPSKLETSSLSDFSQLNLRYMLAEMTHRISVFTEGILMMEKTLLGVLEVEPRQILEDGIRKELVRQISRAMDSNLTFVRVKSSRVHDMANEFTSKLGKLASILAGFRRSFEYIQDYINIYGLKMWQVEYYRVVAFNVEQQCNRYLKRKIIPSQSQYQSRAIPIPSVGKNNNFMGRLEIALLDLTRPGYSCFSPECSSWYYQNGELACGMHIFGLLSRGIGVSGLWGIDRLLSFRIVSMLRETVSIYMSQDKGTSISLYNELAGELERERILPRSGRKLFNAAVKQCGKCHEALIPIIHVIGQCQLLRCRISNELNLGAQIDSNLLWSSLHTLNRSLMCDVLRHYNNVDVHGYPSEDNVLFGEVTRYLDCSGFGAPLSKLYITNDPCCRLPVLLFLCTLSILPKIRYHKDLKTLVHVKERDCIDGVPFAIGIITLLRQFHPDSTKLYIEYVGQYIRLCVRDGFTDHGKMAQAICSEAINCLVLLELMCTYGFVSHKTLVGIIPVYLFDCVSMYKTSKRDH